MLTDNNTGALTAGVCSNNADYTDPVATPYGASITGAGDDGDVPDVSMMGDFTDDLFHLLGDGYRETLAEDHETPCYCRGTRIQTADGEVAVENLKIGDRLVTVGGEILPLKWIVRRSYRDWLAVGNPKLQPVCFKAGAIANRVPARDLLVSPEHAMFLDGMLVPARHLVNGKSILQLEGLEEIDYFHLELDRHAVIFAEGAAAESFVDDDGRGSFHNSREYRQVYPDEAFNAPVEYCAPLVEDGYALEVLRRALAARGARLQPNLKAAPVPARQGYLDRATRNLVEGWALGEKGEGPVPLAIVINGAVVGQTVADRYRADLAVAGIGRCSFRFVLPQGLSPEVSHRIEVRRESDWSLLHGGPILLKPSRLARPGLAFANPPVEKVRLRA
jgi:hypothetical protein